MRKRSSLLTVTCLIVVLCATSASSCPPEEEPDYTLMQFHSNVFEPWQNFYLWNNIHSAQMCDSSGPTSCHEGDFNYCEGSSLGEEFQLHIHEAPLAFGKEWRRDRFMFFPNCFGGCRDTPFFADWAGTYRTGGPYRYWEGEGYSSREEPLGVNIPIAHIRRYHRGLCSAGRSLGAIKNDAGEIIEDGLLEQFENELHTMFECSGSSFFGKAFKSHETWDKDVKVYLGSTACHQPAGADLDYTHVYFQFYLAPKTLIPVANAYFTLDLDLYFRLGTTTRSRFLDCPNCPDACKTDSGCASVWNIPNPGCGQDYFECTRDCSTRECTNVSDCCGLPGVVCKGEGDAVQVTGITCNMDEGAERGVCEKKSFIDMIDYGIEYSTWVSRPCKGSFGCTKIHKIMVEKLGEMKNNLMRDVYAPLLHEMYNMLWQPTVPEPGRCNEPCDSQVEDCSHLSACLLFGCTDDSDCQIALINSSDFEGRCNADQYCEVRPMFMHGVNMYPNELEIVLAWDDTYPEVGLLGLDTGPNGICHVKSVNDSGWSDISNEWIYGTTP